MGAFMVNDEVGMQLAEEQDGATHYNPTINVSINVLAIKVKTFLELSRLLSLSVAEEATMLDVSVSVLLRLRNTPAALTQLGNSKLHRRVDYAIRILHQMRNTVVEQGSGALMASPTLHQ